MTRYDQMLKQYLTHRSEHPEIWALFVQFTFEMIGRGMKHYSTSGVFERIRWETATPDAGPNGFKLSNNMKPFYAREFATVFPDHAGFFRLHEQTSHKHPPVAREFCRDYIKEDDTWQTW